MRLDDATRVLLHFQDAKDAAILPSDRAGGLLPLRAPTGLTTPPLAAGLIGNGRSFNGTTTGLAALEDASSATRMRRSMTVEAVLSFDTGRLTNGARVIVARGLGGSATERRLWGLELVTSGGGTAFGLQAYAEEAGGGAATIPSVALTRLPSSGFFHLAWVRQWVSASEVLYRVYVNGILQGEVTSADGDFSEGIGGTTTVGMRGDALGGYEEFFADVINEIRISNVARVAEEIEHSYRQLVLYPAMGYELVKAHLPPGTAYSTDPDSSVQRELANVGAGLGLAWANLAEFENYFAPDKAVRFLSRWETVLGLRPRPGDTIEIRRGRVQGHLRTVHGFNRDQIRDALAGILDLDAEDLVIIETKNRFVDDFEGVSIHAHWWQFIGNGTITASDPVAVIQLQNGDNGNWTRTVENAPRMYTSILEPNECEVAVQLDAHIIVAGTVNMGGIFIANRVTKDVLRFGVGNDAGTTKFRRSSITGATTTDAFGAAIPGTSPPLWLRILDLGDGTVNCDYSEVGFEGPWTTVFAAVAAPAGYYWAGLFFMDEGATIGGNAQIDVEEFRIWSPNTDRIFEWGVYRDPALPGTPDIEGASDVLRRMKPAHTEGRIITDITAEAGSSDSLCEHCVLGA
jgi:hypothetical protein